MTINVKYVLANNAGYKFKTVASGGAKSYDALAAMHKNNFPDVEITRPGTGTDLSLLHTKALMTVNGVIYPTKLSNGVLTIPNATKAMLRSKNNTIGILSFNGLSKPLEKISLTEGMITSEHLTPMYNKVIITFDKEIKIPVLVMGGYLVFEHPEYFYRVSANSFVLRLDLLNYVERLYELNRQMDIFGALEVPVSNNNNTMIDGALLRSEDVIRRFLTLDNTFLVEIDAKTLTTKKVYLEHSNVPGNFRTEIEPTMPIIVGYGKVAEYTKRKNNDTKHIVYINDAYFNRHLFSSMPISQLNVYNDHRVVGKTYELSHAFFLDIEVGE